MESTGIKKKCKTDVVALGELLIDFTENGMSTQGNPLLEANPGGAPCNVLAMLAKCGKKTAFIGKVGEDSFGNRLEETLQEVGIGTAGLVKDKCTHTTLAFVHTLSDGDREFSFYRNPGADMMLSESEINRELLSDTAIFHYGSLSLTDEPSRTATKTALELAKKSGAILTYDPNLREPLWKDLELAKDMIAYGMSMCDVMKISDNEILWFTGKTDFDDAVNCILDEYRNIKLLLLSLGRDGSRAYLRSEDDTIRKAKAPAFLSEKTIETTGAGDTFCGMVINYILDNGLVLDEKQLTEMLTIANAAASIITTRKGALRVMPIVKEISDMLI